MSKSILTIDTPKGCVFCPMVKMHAFSAFYKNATDKQPYMGMSCPFGGGTRFIYDLTDNEALTYKPEECPLVEIGGDNE